MEERKCVSEGRDVVNTVKVRAVEGRNDRHRYGGDGGDFGEVRVVEHVAEEAFAGKCHEEGEVSVAEFAEV